MRLRTLAGAAVGGLGLAAGTNRLLRSRAGDLGPPLSGRERTYRWRGFDVASTEAGDPDDPDLVLLHGVNASATSFEFRGVFAELADDYHVVAPDFPGFGRSDRPPLSYSGSLYATFVEDFLADELDSPIVVASSLSGAYAATAARSVAVEKLVLVCPTTETMGGRRAWLRSLFRSPVVGQALFNLLTSKPAIRYFDVDHGYADPANVTDDLVDYQWRTAHQPGGRFAPASFVAGFLDLETDLGSTLADVDAPVTLVWGRDAEVTPLSAGEALAEAANARLIVFDDSRLLPHAEHPVQFVNQVLRGADPADAVTIELDESDGAETADRDER